MSDHKVFQMSFAKLYGLLLNKASRKGRTQAEVDEVICWLTGYSAPELDSLRESGISYGDFFRQAPQPNPNCGVRRSGRGRGRPADAGGPLPGQAHR